MSCPCICPDIDCAPVLTCINNDLINVRTGNDPSLDNLCAAVAACVDAQLEAIASGFSNDLDNFGPSIVKILQSLSGYSESGDVYLYSADGAVGWTSGSLAHTYVASGTGVSVTGTGSSGDPYKPNLINATVKALFSAENGLTYTSGVTKLGGALNQNTTITGSNTYNLTITGLQDFILQSLNDTYLQIADYTAASSGDVLTLVNSSNGLVEWRTPSSFGGSFIQNQQATGQVANFRVNGNGWVGIKFTAGSLNQITDTSHFFKGLSGDLYPLVVQDSFGTELLALSTKYLKIPDGTIDPSPAFAAPYHEGSLYYNTGTDNFVGYHSGIWSNFVYDIRNITTADSITGGGNLSTDRTLSLVNDITSPGANQYYSTDGAGIKGWFPVVAGTVSSVDLIAPNIFNVSGNPVTTSGTILMSLVAQGANTFLGGPIGGAGLPSFRLIDSSDLPNSVVTFTKFQNITSSRLLGRSTIGSGSVEELGLGSGLSLAAGILNTKGRTLISVTTFSTTGTWGKAAGTNAVLVYVIGGGGGGGGVSGAGSAAAAAGGGGGGAYSINFITGGIGATELVTVGAGGAGAAVGNNTGSNGGASSFGALVAANGGLGGVGMAQGTTPATALGGNSSVITASTGTIIGAGGNPGGYGLRLSGTVAIGGGSGSSLYNGQQNSASTSGAGAAPNSYGAGGSGAVSTDGNSYAGGPGLSGFVVIYEFS